LKSGDHGNSHQKPRSLTGLLTVLTEPFAGKLYSVTHKPIGNDAGRRITSALDTRMGNPSVRRWFREKHIGTPDATDPMCFLL
jgi:hypothetical protein